MNESPFATHIRPIENQPVRLAMLMSVSGGMQNTIVNMGEVKSFLSSIISLIPDLEDVVMKAKEVMPHGEIALQKSLDIVSETNVSCFCRQQTNRRARLLQQQRWERLLQ